LTFYFCNQFGRIIDFNVVQGDICWSRGHILPLRFSGNNSSGRKG
jgi:hypothetical protein